MRRAIVLAVAVAACSRPERDAGRAVRDYDDELVLAYRTGDASRMARVAAAEEVARIQVLIDLKSASRLVLESTLEAFQATRIQVAPGAASASVDTLERWHYLDRHLRPGEAPGPAFESAMAMRYHLVLEDGRFKVRDVTTLSSQHLERAEAR